MSRVGKLPVPIPSGVTVVVEDERVVRVKGPNGELTHPVLVGTHVVVDGAVARVSSERVVRNPAFGTMRAKLNNMVIGVTTGFVRKAGNRSPAWTATDVKPRPSASGRRRGSGDTIVILLIERTRSGAVVPSLHAAGDDPRG